MTERTMGVSPRPIAPTIRHLLSLAVLASTCLVGCGGGSDARTVSGTVSYQGRPVTSGLINFLAHGGRPLGGGINAGATYSVELPPGDYQVRIDTTPELPPGFKEGDPMPVLPRQVPEKFASFNSSGLTASVKPEGGSQTIDFKLP